MSNLKKIVALVLAMALVMTMFAGAAIKTDLSKYVDGQEFTQAQQTALTLVNAVGIINGVSDNEIGTASLTRAQLVKVLYAMTNGTSKGADKYVAPVFSDVPTTHWAAGYIAWATLTNVVKGVSATEFAPEAKVTPAQAAAMIARVFDPNACMDPATFAQDAQAAAIKLGLTAGIETAGFFGKNETSRGDMFIMLANALTYGKVTLLESVFGVEKIEGAILLGAEKSYYKPTAGGMNGDLAYSVFAFRTSTAGEVTKFATDLLCVEDDPTTDDIGCKYVIYVSKDASYNGFRTLYAAYEMTDDKYYNVREGVVGDGKLVFAGRNQNVFYDNNVVVYVDGDAGYTTADFEKIYAEQKNLATYKLIDNDGDGKVEYAFIVRLTYAQLGVTTVTAKVTAVNANGQITLTTEDGTVYANLVYGNFYDGKTKVLLSNEADIKATLGVQQPNYFPFTAISDVYYDFDIAGGFIFDVNVSEKTAFVGNYGLFLGWSTPMTMYKNMPYALFMNENNEYFWAYVANVNDVANLIPGNGTFDPLEANDLICFTDGDYSDDVVSFYTANYWNDNQTYNWLEAFEWDYDIADDLTVTFPKNVISEIMGKETVDYTDLVVEGEIYAVFGAKTAVNDLAYWDQTQQKYVPMTGTVLTLADRALEGYAVLNYKQLEDKKLYKVTSSKAFYGIEDLDECLGFVIRTDAKVTVSIDLGSADGESFQIYKANGYWHLRFYIDNVTVTADDAVVTWNGYVLDLDKNGNVCIVLDDGNDPNDKVNQSEYIRLAELIKGFDDAAFKDELDAAIVKLVADNNDKPQMSARTLLNVDKAVMFVRGNVVAPIVDNNGRIVDPSVLRWVAFDAKTFNAANFGKTKQDATDINPIQDELIYTVIAGETYVKAMKVTSEVTDILPYAWIAKAGYEVVVYNGLTGAVNTNGWQIDMITVDAEGVKSEKVYTKIGLGNAELGDLLLVKRDTDGNIVELIDVGGDYASYLTYMGGRKIGIINGVLTSATTIEVTNVMEDYNIQTLSGTIVYAVVKGGKYVTTTDFDNAWKNHTVVAYSIAGCTIVVVK